MLAWDKINHVLYPLTSCVVRALKEIIVSLSQKKKKSKELPTTIKTMSYQVRELEFL